MTKIQGQFRPRKRQYFEKRFLPAYSTGIKVPETRVGKQFLFFQNSIGRSLTINPKYEFASQATLKTFRNCEKLSFRFEMFDKVTFYQLRFFHFHPTSFLVLPQLELLFFLWSHFFQIQLLICPHSNQFQLSFQSIATKLSHAPKY